MHSLLFELGAVVMLKAKEDIIQEKKRFLLIDKDGYPVIPVADCNPDFVRSLIISRSKFSDTRHCSEEKTYHICRSINTTLYGNKTGLFSSKVSAN